MTRAGLVMTIVWVWSAAVPALAQPPAEPAALTFEIASIRRSPPIDTVAAADAPLRPISLTVLAGGRFEARRQTLADLVRIAYSFEHVPLAPGVLELPSAWVGRDRFDLTATAGREWTTPPAETVIPTELRSMLWTLLEEQFGVQARLETKDIAVVALRLSNRTGALGAGLRPSATACPGLADTHDESAASGCLLRIEPNRLAATGVTMAEAARIVARFRDLGGPSRIVVDQTGLEGTYDLVLSLTYGLAPDPFQSLLAGGPEPADRQRLSITRRDRALPDALKAQLGLEMRQTKVPMPTLRIERARRFREQ